MERAPIPRCWLPRLQEQPPDRLSDPEVDELVRLPNPHGFVVRLALGTGLRWAELCRTLVEHVDAGQPSLAALQELLGHASIVTTQKYARLSEDLVRREVERLQAAG